MHVQASQRSPQHGRSLRIRCDRGAVSPCSAAPRGERCSLSFFAALFLARCVLSLALRLLTCSASMLRNRSFRFMVAALERAASSGAQLDSAEGGKKIWREPKRRRTRGEEAQVPLLLRLLLPCDRCPVYGHLSRCPSSQPLTTTSYYYYSAIAHIVHFPYCTLFAYSCLGSSAARV